MTIKDKYLKVLSCLVILLLGMSLVPAASANSASSDVPSIPNVFKGSLKGDAANAGPGTVITAYMDSKLVFSGQLDKLGKYQVAVNGTEKDNGKVITFKLAGVSSQPVSVTYNHGAVPVEVDLTFYGDFIPPTIESLSASPKFILNDGKDFSTVRAKVVGKPSGAPSVTLDLTRIGQGVASLRSEGGSLYSYDIKSTVTGYDLKLPFTAANPSGSSVIDENSISITILSESQLAAEFGGTDRVFSAEEIKSLVSNNEVSSGIKYKVLSMYFADALHNAPASTASAGRIFPAKVSPGQEFQVTVNVAKYGTAGQILEKLPAGFIFVKSTLPEKAVTVNGSEVSFLLMGETSFSYTVKAPATTGTYKVVGLLRDINKVECTVTPADCSITVGQSGTVTPPDNGGSGGGSGGSGGSGGGAGASQEPQSNVEAKELSQKSVTAGKHVKFDFPKGVTCIRYVEFDAKKTLGKVTTIVEMLKGQSKLVSSLPEGSVYKNVNIWVGSGGVANSNNLENAVVGFRVEKAWLEKSGADESSVALWLYDKTWNKLETKKVGEDNTYVFFDAKTPGFGCFTIVVPGEKIELASPEDTDPSNTDKDTEPIATNEEKPKQGIPGFESVIAIGVLGVVYQVMRRK